MKPSDLFSRRSVGQVKSDKQRDKRSAVLNDQLACLTKLLVALRNEAPVLDVLSDYSGKDLKDFETGEGRGVATLPALPDVLPHMFEKAVQQAERYDRKARAKAQFWRLCRVAKANQVQDLQSLEVRPAVRSKDGVVQDEYIQLNWSIDPPRDVPVVLLDADANPMITERFYLGATIKRMAVRPNADVIMIADHRFVNFTLKRESTRKNCVKKIAMERFQDAGGDVFCVATQSIVRLFFQDQDQGHDLSGMNDKACSDFMLRTPMHGVQWAWFGAATLGSNRWKDCTTLIIMGREELPVTALETIGRMIWGQGLDLINEDPQGNVLLPITDPPFEMVDGSAMTVRGPAHPDPRIRAVQVQSCESATRQAFERLRLAASALRKRVVLGSSVPNPGLPVSQILCWEDDMPTGPLLALIGAKGALRLSPRGLSQDAPNTFPNLKTAQNYIKKSRYVSRSSWPSYR